MKNNQLIKGIEHLSDEEKLNLFKVEELETRLEMAAVAEASGNSVCNNNGACGNKVQIDAGCW